jgi:hypothetical protein
MVEVAVKRLAVLALGAVRMVPGAAAQDLMADRSQDDIGLVAESAKLRLGQAGAAMRKVVAVVVHSLGRGRR